MRKEKGEETGAQRGGLASGLWRRVEEGAGKPHHGGLGRPSQGPPGGGVARWGGKSRGVPLGSSLIVGLSGVFRVGSRLHCPGTGQGPGPRPSELPRGWGGRVGGAKSDPGITDRARRRPYRHPPLGERIAPIFLSREPPQVRRR